MLDNSDEFMNHAYDIMVEVKRHVQSPDVPVADAVALQPGSC